MANDESDDQTECANMSVPLDRNNAHSYETITIAMARTHCSDPSARIETLFYNLGGPAKTLSSADCLPEKLLAYFDIMSSLNLVSR